MLERNDWTRSVPAGAVTLAGFAPRGAAVRFGSRKPGWRDFDLTVDLGEEFFTRRWWRGFATLTALLTAAALLTPRFEPLPGGHPAPLGESQQAQMTAAGVGAASEGSRSGVRMAATARVAPLTSAPERPTIDLFARVAPGDGIGRLLARLGAAWGDAGRAETLIGQVPAGTAIEIRLGRKSGATRPVERIALRGGLDSRILVTASPAGLALQRIAIAVDNTPLRIRGRAGDGLYWSLRAAGVSPSAAEEYLKALATQLDVGSDIAPSDRFDLIVANRRAATGETEPGALLFAGIDRDGHPPLRLLKWSVGGADRWFEASGVGRQTSGMMWPVNAPITSTFGERWHPILHFMRMHSGIDFGVHWGTPVVAAADGQVERAGWAGGYGQQIRLGHAGGIETSYSHLSRLAVAPGMAIRQGQLIGYSGSTGLSTGPHLHYEVLRGGRAINPLAVRFISHSVLEGPALAAFQARLTQLLGVGAHR